MGLLWSMMMEARGALKCKRGAFVLPKPEFNQVESPPFAFSQKGKKNVIKQISRTKA